MHFIEEAALNALNILDKFYSGSIRFMNFKMEGIGKTITRVRFNSESNLPEKPKIKRHFL